MLLIPEMTVCTLETRLKYKSLVDISARRSLLSSETRNISMDMFYI